MLLDCGLEREDIYLKLRARPCQVPKQDLGHPTSGYRDMATRPFSYSFPASIMSTALRSAFNTLSRFGSSCK